MLGRRHGALPDLPLLDLAVAEDAVHARVLGGELEAERHAERDGQALTERARCCLDAGEHHPVRMALQRAAELPEGDDAVHGEEAGLGHAEVLGGHAVSLGQDEAVAVLPVRTPGVVPQTAEVERW